MSGLVVLPIIAQLAMQDGGWRHGWVAIGITALAVGFLPVWLFLVRRPEDVGLVPDRITASTGPAVVEPRYSRAAAMRTQAFWLLVALHRAGLPGAGRRQPAPGAASHRKRPVAPRRRHGDQLLLGHVGRRELRRRLPAAALAVALRDVACRRPAGDGDGGPDRRRLGRSRLPVRRPVRAGHRRRHDPAAHGLGRLFRTGELRRHPRRRPVAAGPGPGGRSGRLRPAA